MKKVLYTLVSILSLAFFISSCHKNYGEDFNKDQNGIYNLDYKSKLSGAIWNFAQNGGNAYLMNPQLYVQYQTQNVYTNEMRYSDIPGAWARYYANQIKPLTDIIEHYAPAGIADVNAQGSKENMVGVAKIFRAIIYKRVTDYFGSAPLTEASKIEDGIRTPKYDDQETIYKFILAELVAGRNMLSPSTAGPKGDPIYSGDVTKWGKLANSVLMQASLQLSKKYPSPTGYPALAFKEALSNSYGSIDKVSDEAWFKYSASDLLTNPLFAFRSADYRLSRELTSSLRGLNDEFNRTSNHTKDMRLALFSSNKDGVVDGVPYGYTTQSLGQLGYSVTSASIISTRFRSSESPASLFTAAYSLLNRAEAAELGWTNENSTTLLRDAIILSYKSFINKYVTGTAPYTYTGSINLDDYAITYANARVNDAATKMLQVIREEKWVALFNNGADAWAEWRRTGYPVLKPAADYVNSGVIPRRMNYPAEETTYNTTNYESSLKGLTPSANNNSSRVWWDLQ